MAMCYYTAYCRHTEDDLRQNNSSNKSHVEVTYILNTIFFRTGKCFISSINWPIFHLKCLISLRNRQLPHAQYASLESQTMISGHWSDPNHHH